MIEKQSSLPFDQYQRYRIVADVLEKLGEGSRSLRILDVSGEESIVEDFLAGDLVAVLDRPESSPGFGGPPALPFEDGSYDYVISVDAFERVGSEARNGYLSELRRVSRKGVLLAGPFDSGVIRGAERTANEFHRWVYSTDDARLKEHAENGLPRLDDARSFFDERGDEVFVLHNGYVPHWLAMTCLTFYGSKLDGQVLERVNAFYNEFLYEMDNIEPSYRQLIVSLKEPASVDFEGLISRVPGTGRVALSSTLFGTLSTVLPLETELKRLNVLLAGYEKRLVEKDGVLARKEAQVGDLSRKLAHSVSAAHIERSRMRERFDVEKSQMQEHYDVERKNLQARLDGISGERDRLRQQLEGVTGSRAWRVLSTLHRFKLWVLKPVRVLSGRGR